MMTGTPETVTLVPINRIEILNSRDRNMKVFEEIVDNIRAIGLKKPITVAERPGDDGEPRYVLVCGEGRLNAFRILGETHIPALVVDVTDEDAFIMSLAENIARRGYRPLEILADIEVLRKRGYSAEIIIQKTGLSPKYVKDIVFLLDQGEERLIEGVQRGTIPLTTALEIARANENATEGDGQANLGDLLQEAYRIFETARPAQRPPDHRSQAPDRKAHGARPGIPQQRPDQTTHLQLQPGSYLPARGGAPAQDGPQSRARTPAVAPGGAGPKKAVCR
jgi:ParB family chromosome partitioning protein